MHQYRKWAANQRQSRVYIVSLLIFNLRSLVLSTCYVHWNYILLLVFYKKIMCFSLWISIYFLFSILLFFSIFWLIARIWTEKRGMKKNNIKAAPVHNMLPRKHVSYGANVFSNGYFIKKNYESWFRFLYHINLKKILCLSLFFSPPFHATFPPQ